MAVLDRHFRVTEESSRQGLNCTDTGLSLAGVPLLRKTASGFAPRSTDEIVALMKGAYGPDIDAAGLSPRLGVIAQALNRGDLGRAMIAALHLRLPMLSEDGAAGIAHANDALAKYDPNEPRDWRGRWTTGGGDSAAAPTHPSPRPTPVSAPPVSSRQGSLTTIEPPSRPASVQDPASTAPWGGTSHLYGGRIIPAADAPEAGIGDNGPPPDAELIPEREPSFDAPKIPPGWDIPGETLGGLYNPPTRNPTFPNGTPWPRITPELVKQVLERRQQGVTPYMVIYVPQDHVGPLLVGSTADVDYEKPEGYDVVTLRGTPQINRSGGVETGHALDGILEALRLAETNEFSEISFNRTLTNSTGNIVESIRRPDVTAAVRPELKLPYQFYMYESLSPGQKKEDRAEELPDVPGITHFDARSHKRAVRLSPEYCEYLGVRYLCS